MRKLAKRLTVAAAASFVSVLPVAAQTTLPTEPDRFAYWPHMGWGGGWYGGPIMLLVWIGIVVAIVVLLVRTFSGPGRAPTIHQQTTGKTAIDILKERFARGEIDKAEFEDKRRLLGE